MENIDIWTTINALYLNQKLVFRNETKKVNKAHILMILSLTALYNVSLEMQNPNQAFEVSKLMIWVMNNHFHSGSFSFIVSQIEKHNKKFCGKLTEEKKEFMAILNKFGKRFFPEMGLVHDELSSDDDPAEKLKTDMIGRAFESLQKRTRFLKKEKKELRLDKFEEEEVVNEEQRARNRKQRSDIRSIMQQTAKPKPQGRFPMLSSIFETQNYSLHSGVQSQRSKSKTAKQSTTIQTPYFSNRHYGGETSVSSRENTGSLQGNQMEEKSREMCSLELSGENSLDEQAGKDVPYIGIENYSIDVDTVEESAIRKVNRKAMDPFATDLSKHESLIQSVLGSNKKPMERCLAGLVLSSLKNHRCVPIQVYFKG